MTSYIHKGVRVSRMHDEAELRRASRRKAWKRLLRFLERLARG